MADVVLFSPPEHYSQRLGTRRCPLGLLHVAAPLVGEGMSVAIIDAGTCPDWRAALREAIDEKTICAGVTVMTGYPIRGALEFSKTVKAIRSIPVVWGGIHPSLLPEQTIQNDLVDVLLVGEGDQRFSQVVRSLRDNSGLDHIPGIYYTGKETIHRTAGEIPAVDLDQVPELPYHLVDVEAYIYPGPRYLPGRKRCFDLNTDRGCPWRCGFCYNLKYNHRRWRAMSANRVLDRLEALVQRYRLDGINFVSDNFFVDKRRVAEIAQGLLDRSLDIAWHADMRLDLFLRYDDDLLRLMHRSGCTALTFGVESGSDRVLKQIDKDLTVKLVKRGHERALAHGFKVNYHFILGLPEETIEDVYRTLDLIWHLGQSPEIAIFGPTIYTPYPGTPLYDRCLQLGFQPPQELEGWADLDWQEFFLLPWFSKSHRRFLREAALLVSAAFGSRRICSLWTRSQQAYFRLRFSGFRRGIRLYEVDRKLVRLLKRGFRAVRSPLL